MFTSYYSAGYASLPERPLEPPECWGPDREDDYDEEEEDDEWPG